MTSSGKAKTVVLQSERSRYSAIEERGRNYVGEQIAAARTQRKLTQGKFCRLLAEHGVEIGIAGLSKWEMGKSVPNAYQLIAIAFALGIEDDLAYFFEGKSILNAEGQKKLRDYKADLIASGRYKPPKPKKQIVRIEMPVSYLRVSAGTGAFLDDGNFEMVSFPENLIPSGAEFGVYVSGDSMEPAYHDGQIVWVQQCESLDIGEVGIFFYDGNGYIKSYDEQEPDEDHVEDYTDSDGCIHAQPVLVSINECYQPIVVSPNAAFQIVGRVL